MKSWQDWFTFCFVDDILKSKRKILRDYGKEHGQKHEFFK